MGGPRAPLPGVTLALLLKQAKHPGAPTSGCRRGRDSLHLGRIPWEPKVAGTGQRPACQEAPLPCPTAGDVWSIIRTQLGSAQSPTISGWNTTGCCSWWALHCSRAQCRYPPCSPLPCENRVLSASTNSYQELWARLPVPR